MNWWMGGWLSTHACSLGVPALPAARMTTSLLYCLSDCVCLQESVSYSELAFCRSSHGWNGMLRFDYNKQMRSKLFMSAFDWVYVFDIHANEPTSSNLCEFQCLRLCLSLLVNAFDVFFAYIFAFIIVVLPYAPIVLQLIVKRKPG